MSNTISLYNPSPEKTIDFTLEGCCPITLKTADECRVPDNSTGKVEKIAILFLHNPVNKGCSSSTVGVTWMTESGLDEHCARISSVTLSLSPQRATGNVDIGHFFFYQDPVTRRLITKALIASWNEDLQKYAIESVRNFSYPLSQRLKKSFISGEFVVNYTSVNGARTLFPFPALQECPLSKNKFSSQLKRAHETGSRYSVALIRKSEGEAFWVDGATWKKQIASPINPSTNEAVQEEAINLKSVIGYEWFACEPGSNEFVAVPAPIGQQWKIIEPDMECCPLTKSNIADLALKALDKNQLLYSVVKEGKTICDAEAWFKRHKACCIEHQHSDIEVYYRSSFDPLYSRINKLFNAAFLKVYSEYVQNPARFELKDLVTLFQQNSSYASISQFAKDFNDPNKDFKGFLELVENATELQLVAYDTESRKSGSTANYNHMFEELNIADRAYLESFSATEL